MMSSPLIETSAADDRKYHWFTLPNNLRCLVISDPSTDKASAAMDVNIGQYCDGTVNGLAHFLEHMLFMGTEKYPKENDYQVRVKSGRVVFYSWLLLQLKRLLSLLFITGIPYFPWRK